MNREIKFRAWNKQKGIMNYDNEDDTEDYWDGIYTSDIGMVNRLLNIPDKDDHDSISSFRNKYEVMQFTGLGDKNGVEIYEGDILTSHCYPFQDDGRYNYHGVVEWIDDCGSFYITKRLVNRKKMGLSDGISEPIENTGWFEVIGNIYENQELLEEETK